MSFRFNYFSISVDVKRCVTLFEFIDSSALFLSFLTFQCSLTRGVYQDSLATAILLFTRYCHPNCPGSPSVLFLSYSDSTLFGRDKASSFDHGKGAVF
jgi:hypothetical protein